MAELTAEQAYQEATFEYTDDGGYKSASIPFIVSGATDEDGAITAAGMYSAAYVHGMIRDGYTVEERLGNDSWRIAVGYKIPEKKQKEPETWDHTFSFDTGGGSIHLQQSLATRNKYPETAPDYGGAINYDGQDVQGVDVTRPVYNFSETRYFYNSDMTDSFKAALARKTGMYNNDSFKGFDEGEVLFLGASGRRNGDDPDDLWEVTFIFAAAQNQSNLTIGSITDISKRGWDYLWVRYEDSISSDATKILKKPVAVYVEKVYYGTDFSSLGLDD